MWGRISTIVLNVKKTSVQIRSPLITSIRTFIDKEPKRFYKNVSVTIADGGKYEVNLDQRKLRTPSGTLFQVPSEPLALAVAQEWKAQGEKIKRHDMQVTNLCNTAIDNPTHRPRDVVVNGILEFLDTDTICYRMEEPEELAKFESTFWDPIMNWVKDRYGVEIIPTTGIGIPEISDETRAVFKQHILSHNDWALVGYQQVVENLKSLILALALIEKQISVEAAVRLSRLELEFQIGKWGNVEWHHDIERLALQARVAAATLFVHLNNESTTIKSKGQKYMGT